MKKYLFVPPHIGRTKWQAETLAYLALPGVSLTVPEIIAIDSNIQLIKFSTGVALASVTANLSLAASYYFVTNSSVDLRPYALIPGVQFSVAATGTPATTAVFGGTVTAGTGEGLSDELITSWTNNAGSYPFETFTSSGSNISSAINSTGLGYAASQELGNIKGKLFKGVMALTISGGSLRYHISVNATGGSPTGGKEVDSSGLSVSQTFTKYLTVATTESRWINVSTSDVTNASANCSFKQITAPNSTGFTASTLMDGGINANSASYVVTITKP